MEGAYGIPNSQPTSCTKDNATFSSQALVYSCALLFGVANITFLKMHEAAYGPQMAAF